MNSLSMAAGLVRHLVWMSEENLSLKKKGVLLHSSMRGTHSKNPVLKTFSIVCLFYLGFIHFQQSSSIL